MLTIAVAATLIGFGLLVFALVTANFWLAVACIVVCVLGLVILLVDTVRAGKRGRGGVRDEPLFTIRGRESVARREPLLGDDDTDGSDGSVQDRSPRSGTNAALGLGAAGVGAGAAGTAAVGAHETGQNPTTPVRPGGGLGSIVSPDAHGAAVADSPETGGQAPATGSNPTGQNPTGQNQIGNADDYVRSVTGSFPAQTPTGGQQAVDPTEPNAHTPSGPIYTQSPEAARLHAQESGPATGGWSVPDTAGRSVGTSASATGGWSAVPTTSESESSGHDGAGQNPAGQEAVGQPGAGQYVGRRRLPDEGESLVVNSPDPTLPEMTLVYGDSYDENGREIPASETPSDTDESTE